MVLETPRAGYPDVSVFSALCYNLKTVSSASEAPSDSDGIIMSLEQQLIGVLCLYLR